MKKMFCFLVFLVPISFLNGQTSEVLRPLRILLIKDAWIKIEKNGAITDSIEAQGNIGYNFMEFNPHTKLVKVSYSNGDEWIPRGRGYFTLNDIEPLTRRKILINYAQSSGDSIPLKEYQNFLKQKWEEMRGEKLKILIRKYGNRIANLIIDHGIMIGMTEEMVIESWGKPRYINKTKSALIRREQWVYRKFYVYFDDGILTDFKARGKPNRYR